MSVGREKANKGGTGDRKFIWEKHEKNKISRIIKDALVKKVANTQKNQTEDDTTKKKNLNSCTYH